MSNPMQLRPEEWKTMSLLNLAQVQNFITSIPGVLESGKPGIEAEHLAVFDSEVARARTMLLGWQRSRFDVPQAEAPKQEAHAGNGAAEPAPKRKGGWQKGRPRKPKPEAEAAQ